MQHPFCRGAEGRPTIPPRADQRGQLTAAGCLGVSLNCSIYCNFLGQLRRIPLPRTWMNKGRNRRRLAASQFAPTANKHLYFVDERQQVLKRWVEPPPAPSAEAGLGRFVRLGGEFVPRRPPSRILGVRVTRHHEVGVEALYLLTDLGKTADRHIRVRTEPAYGPLQRVAVDVVALFVGDQDTHVAFTLTLVSEPSDGGEDVPEGDVLVKHLVCARPKDLLVNRGILQGGHHQHRDGGISLVQIPDHLRGSLVGEGYVHYCGVYAALCHPPAPLGHRGALSNYRKVRLLVDHVGGGLAERAVMLHKQN